MGNHNHAIDVNPPTLNGITADIHITSHGSDWYWTAFSIFALSSLVSLFLGFRRPPTDRIFHYITTAIFVVTAIDYFTMASDLGFVPIAVEFHRGGKVSGNLRQIFYVRYIDWFITTPLLLLNLFLTAVVPWSQILFTVFMDMGMIVCGLVGALVTSRYKWGYFTIGCSLFFYVVSVILLPGRRHASTIGTDISRAYNMCGLWLIFFWFLYPIAWGVCEGGNVITPDSEAVFYGVLDILSKIGFAAILLWSHRKIDPARLGLRIRAYDEMPGGAVAAEKNGQHTAPAATTATA